MLEERLLDETIDQETFKRMHNHLQNKMDQVDQHLLRLEGDRSIDFKKVEEVLSMTQNIHKTYIEASFEVKRHVLSFFFEEILAKDGEIVGFKANPIFESLREMNEVILKNDWLPRLDSNQQPFA